MSLRLNIERGGEYLLPYAKKRLTDMKVEAQRLYAPVLHKKIQVSTGEIIFLQSIKLLHGIWQDSIRITSTARGWNAYWRQDGGIIRIYNAPERLDDLAMTSASSSDVTGAQRSSDGTYGLLLSASNPATQAFFNLDMAVQGIKIYDASDVGKTNPRFPKSGISMFSPVRCETTAGSFLVCTLAGGPSVRSVLVNLGTEFIVAEDTFESTFAKFLFFSQDEAWMAVEKDFGSPPVAQTLSLWSTTGKNRVLDLSPGNTRALGPVTPLGLISGEPTVLILGEAISGPSLQQLSAVDASGSTTIYTANTATTGEFFGGAIAGAVFGTSPGEYYEVLFSVTIPVDALNDYMAFKYFTYSSTDPAGAQLRATLPSSETAQGATFYSFSGLRPTLKDHDETNGVAVFPHDGHLYVLTPHRYFTVSAPSKAFEVEIYLLSVPGGMQLKKTYPKHPSFDAISISSEAIAIAQNGTTNGFVFRAGKFTATTTDIETYFITPSGMPLLDTFSGAPTSLFSNMSLIVPTQASIFYFYVIQDFTNRIVRRGIFDLVTGSTPGITNFTYTPVQSGNIPFISGLMADGKAYCYVRTRAATQEEKDVGGVDGGFLVTPGPAITPLTTYMSIMSSAGAITPIDPPTTLFVSPVTTRPQVSDLHIQLEKWAGRS